MKPYALFALLFLPFSIQADNQHHLGLTSYIHLEQSSTPGFGINYQWQFSESFTFESQFQQSGDVNIKAQAVDISGDYSQLLLGTNFSKAFNNKIGINAGIGASYVTRSDNELLVKQSALAPYLKLSLSYQYNNNVSFEIGQFSQFQSQAISNNHNLFFNVKYSFSNDEPLTIVKTSNKPYHKANDKITTEIAQTEQVLIAVATTENTVDDQQTTLDSPTAWFIQLGAFSSEVNAQKILTLWQSKAALTDYQVLFYQQFYRVISKRYTDKHVAIAQAKILKSKYGIASFVTLID